MKLRNKVGVTAALLALAGLSASATDLAILRNGSAIRHQYHEARQSVTRLYLTESMDSFVDVPTEDIVSYEKIESPTRPVPSVAPPPALTLEEVIGSASNRNRLDPDLVASLIRAESGFNTKAISSKGAQGLMQLMPQTAAELGVGNPLDPVANVEGGTQYLRKLLDLYKNDLIKALAAYNAGPGRVASYRGLPPYLETLAYIERVLSDFHRRKLARKNQGQSTRSLKVLE